MEAQGRAMEEQQQRLMSQVPKTAAGFNMDFKALKKNAQSQFQYLKRIPFDTIKGYFKKTEIETAIFSEMMRTLADQVDSDEEATWASNFMMALSTAANFDMTLMFAEDDEKAWIDDVIGKIRATDAGKADKVKAAFSE